MYNSYSIHEKACFSKGGLTKKGLLYANLFTISYFAASFGATASLPL
ncbi:hypothetical protein HMPREF3293_02396 [Christensenella minuta]|jgi:hypothetical protein|uniref:Uncharacterized protein n=1 Tax=Christensenella minuta TaxID=626937 RepID=A0A136Q375_9FIRM|nr:hypothetical protein HMPREF3293_02396 [Christensenella minuta]